LYGDAGEAAAGDVDAETATRAQRIPVGPAVAHGTQPQPRQGVSAAGRRGPVRGRRRHRFRCQLQRVEQNATGVERLGDLLCEPLVYPVQRVRLHTATKRSYTGGVLHIGGVVSSVNGDDSKYMTTDDKRE